MEKEYRVGLFSKLFYGLLATIAGVFFSFFIFDKPLQNTALYLIPLLYVVFSILVIINLFRSRVVITATSITRERVFYSKTLNFADVKGVRIFSKYILLEPKDKISGRLKIGRYNDLAHSEELTKQLRALFVDLNQIDIDKEQKQILGDTDVGDTLALREGFVRKMRLFELVYSSSGFILFLLLLFIRNSSVVFVIGAFYPWLGILIMHLSKGLIKFTRNSERSAYLGISIGFSMPVVMLALAAIMQFEILHSDNLLPLTFLFAMILFIPLYFIGINKKASSVIGQVIVMALICLAFGFGFTVSTNCIFDESAPAKFKTTVSDEYISTGKGARYHLKLHPWYKGDYIREVDVSAQEYFSTPIGSTVIITQKKGLFDIAWFTVKTPSHNFTEGYGDPPNIK